MDGREGMREEKDRGGPPGWEGEGALLPHPALSGRGGAAAVDRWHCSVWCHRSAGLGDSRRAAGLGGVPGSALPARIWWKELRLKQANQAPPSPLHLQWGWFRLPLLP